VCDPDPPDAVRNREWAEERKEPQAVSHAKEDHREARANADRGDQGSYESFGKGEIREVALQRPVLRPDAPGRTGPLRSEQSIRKFHAVGRFRFDDDEADIVFLFPRPVSAFRGHGWSRPSHKIPGKSNPARNFAQSAGFELLIEPDRERGGLPPMPGGSKPVLPVTVFTDYI